MLSIFLVFSTAEESLADPKVCTGFQRSEKKGEYDWGKKWRVKQTLGVDCPRSYAVYEVQTFEFRYDFAGVTSDKTSTSVSFNCCPLPSGDILSEKHEYVDNICPDESVVTGAKFSFEDKKQMLRCTFIDSSKYTLRKPTSAQTWGLSTREALPWRYDNALKFIELPSAIRYGIARNGRRTFEVSGCIGKPIGALFVGKTQKLCKNTFFSVLERKNVGEGDKVISMYPECIDVSSPYETNPVCIKSD